MSACGHPICELIGGSCSLAVTRSRGCHASAFAAETAPAVVAEVRALLAGALDRDAAVRLAQLVRAEALEERSLLAAVHDDDPALGAALARLLAPGR
jgi:hypothetical protein|nr:hypothetical protein [Kofleriaceae bacterium]